jgi:hypothetical protein
MDDSNETEFQSEGHEGLCCSSCDYEWQYTDVGMRNFGFGCCCLDERNQ